jgi:hypothetical protein
MAEGTLFISYRRDDTRADAGRLYDRLNSRFPGRVFRDIGSIEPGTDWREVVDEVLRSTDACVVVIGPLWLNIRDDDGSRRIDDPFDPVRREVASALASGTRVIPVLVGGASMPDRDDLPADLQPLVRRNAVSLSEQDFDAGVERLMKALDRVSESAVRSDRHSPRRRWIAAALGLAIVALVASALLFKRESPPESNRSSGSVDASAPVAPASPSASTAAGDREPAAGTDGAALGQITLEWAGTNAVAWQVEDERGRNVLRYSSAGAGLGATVDIAAGRYVVVLPSNPEIAPLPVTVSGGQSTVVSPAIGQITLQWNGNNSTAWQVFDEKKRKPLRYLAAGAGKSETVDIATGKYVVVVDKPEMPPVPVAVTEGRAVTVTPRVGQIAFEWGGQSAAIFQIVDAERKDVLRNLSIGASGRENIDVAPGRYLIVLSGNPEIKPIPVTVDDGREVHAAIR